MRISILRDISRPRFWRAFAVNAFAGIGVMAVLFGIYDVIEPNAISKVEAPTAIIVLVAALLYATWRCWPRPVEQQYSKPKTMIRIVEGDIFDEQSNLVIGMTTSFDTDVPQVISATSIQGQFLEKVFGHDRSALDAELAAALSAIRPEGNIKKPGKTTTYATGTVATIRQNRRHFFCVAYSSMDLRNQASATIDGLWRSLNNLWDEVRARTNGDPVATPIIGGGQSRISQILPAQDSVRFIALSFILASRHAKVCDRLDIVVRPEDSESLDMLEIQAFLRSLRE
ncbi:macro domain-containing protein [Micromonospora sp. ZYX-F-536]|uniref:macro domain-containing protein n=1 Tax=Micromonospora sp. ZYX-F-536 TaxID=3457629 RepID=UPI004040C92E